MRCTHIIINLVVLRSGNRRGGAGSGGPYGPGEGMGPGPGAPEYGTNPSIEGEGGGRRPGLGGGRPIGPGG